MENNETGLILLPEKENDSDNSYTQLDEEPVKPDIKGTEARSLRYDFTAIEVHELSVMLANKTQELQRLENAKKSSAAAYKAQIDAINEEIGQTANKVASGYEYRDLACEVLYNKPTLGMKTFIRPDTGRVFTEQMTEADYAYVAKQKEPTQQELF